MNKTRQLFGAMMLFVSMLSLFTACGEKVEDEIKTGTGTSGTTSLSVSPSSLSFSGSGGRLSLKVSTIYDYIGADTSADWLDYDFNDALNTMYITATANPTDKTRNATLTVMGSNDGNTVSARVTVKVEQEAGKVETSTTVTISPSGGKVEMGDISINFPSGTFNSDAKVEVSEVTKGLIDGEQELSKFYKIKFNSGISKSFKASIKSSKFTDKNVLMEFVTPGWAPSLNQYLSVPSLFEVTYTDGAYVADIPAMDSPDKTDDMEVHIGLAHYIDYDDENLARTRAETKRFNFRGITTNRALCRKIRSYIPVAMKKIEDLKFKEEGVISYTLVRLFSGNVWGACCWSTYSKTMSYILLNLSKLETANDTQLQQTVIHETFHYYQQFHDRRDSKQLNKDGQTTATILDEGTSSWSEYLYDGYRPDGVQECLGECLGSLNPKVEDIHNLPYYQIYKDKAFQNIGYGISALFVYLTDYKKLGNGIIKEMWDERYSAADLYNTLAIIEKIAKSKKIDVFSQSVYKDFVEAVGCGKVFTKNKEYGFVDMVQDRAKHDYVGIMERTISSIAPVTFINYAFGYGALLEKMTIDAKTINLESMISKNTRTIIEQRNKNVKTWVYKEDKSFKCTLVGEAKRGEPLDINDTFYKTDGKYADQYKYYFVTIPNDFKTTEAPLSEVEVRFVDADIIVDEEVEFEAEGGTKYIDILVSNLASYKPEEDIKWLEIKPYKTDMQLIAEANTTTNPREGKIIVHGLDAKGNKVIKKEIKVTQKGKPETIIDKICKVEFKKCQLVFTGFVDVEWSKKGKSGKIDGYEIDMQNFMVGFNIDKKTISMDKNTTILVLEGQTNTLSGKLTLEMSDNKITKFTWKESINNDGQFDLSLIATNLQIIGGYGGSPYYIYGQGDGKGDFTIPEFKCKTIGKQMSNLTGILPADGSPTQYMLHKESVINIKGVTEGKKCGISCHLSY